MIQLPAVRNYLSLWQAKSLGVKYQRGEERKLATHADRSSDRDVAILSPLKISRTIKISFSARDNYCLKKV